MTRRNGESRQRAKRGFSLLELLVVMAVLAILMAALVPLASERLRLARIRTAVNQLTLDLRAARWTAVAGRSTVDLTVAVDPENRYEYTDVRGRVRAVTLPEGVRIVSSTTPIRFNPNGSVAGGSSTVIEMPLTAGVGSRWTVSTNVLGVSTTTSEQVDL